jgi:hypothetical protein
MRGRITAAWACILTLATALPGVSAMASIPDVVQPADTRPDRGDVAGSPHVTGPTSPIHSFYNEDLEISFWRGPADMAFSLAKNDVWDRRYLADGKRLITLEDVRRVCFGGPEETKYLNAPNSPHGLDLGLPDTAHALYLAYDFPCPKPVGQVIVRCPDLEGRTDWTAGRADGGALSARAEKGAARAGLWAFLHSTRNLLVIRGEYRGLTQPLEVQLYRHQDTTPQGTSIPGLAHFGGDTGYDYSRDKGNGPLPHPTAGADGRFFWIRQAFPADKTFPRGFEYVTMGCVAGSDVQTRAESRVTGAGVKSTVHPLTEAGQQEVVGWLKELRIAAERLNEAGSGSLAAATLSGAAPAFTAYIAVVTTRDAADPMAAARKQLTEALAAGPEALLLESMAATKEQRRAWRASRVMHYNATSCTWADATPWHGDYHFNEVYCADDIVAGGADGLEQRLRMCEEMLPALRRNAREVFGCRGIAFPLVHYPIRSDRVVYSNVVWEWGIENTALVLQPFWQVFQYTQDMGFLRRRAYPIMAEAARFYADYVKRGEDGLYHVIPTVSQEHRGFTPGFRLNRDSVGALSFVKYQLRACIEASELLGVDAAERAQWRETVEHLAPYPTLDTPGGPVFCDVRDAPDLLNYNITANLIMVLWAEDISLDSPPEALEMARRSVRALPDREHSQRPGYISRIETSLGIPKTPDFSPQGRVLSWPGRIHLYAGVPEGIPIDDRFEGLLAVGGFRVSAAHVGQDVRGVRIRSLAGRLCKAKSPWGAGEVKVMALPSRTLVAHHVDGDTIVFPTHAGETYALLAGPELSLAGKRYQPAETVIGRWSFARQAGGVVADDSGRGHGATLVGGAALRAKGGPTALDLSGREAYARVERTRDFDFGAGESFSVEARIRAPAGPPPYMIPILCSMAERQYCFMLADGRAYLYLSSPNGAVNCYVGGETLLTDGRWHAVKAVRDVSEGVLRVFVDGRLEGEAADLTAGDFSCNAPVTIGAYLWGAHSRYARGQIADVCVKSLGKLVDKG